MLAVVAEIFRFLDYQFYMSRAPYIDIDIDVDKIFIQPICDTGKVIPGQRLFLAASIVYRIS